MNKKSSLSQINVALKETDPLTMKTLHKQKKPPSFCQSLLPYVNLLSILIRPCFFVPPRAASHPKPCLINIDAHSICLPVAPLFSFVGGMGIGFHSTYLSCDIPSCFQSTTSVIYPTAFYSPGCINWKEYLYSFGKSTVLNCHWFWKGWMINP